MGEGEIVKVKHLVEVLSDVDQEAVLVMFSGTNDDFVRGVDVDIDGDADVVAIDTVSVTNSAGGNDTHLLLRRPYL